MLETLILLISAVIIVPLFRALRSSPVLGYLTAGVLIGPFGFAFIKDLENVKVLAEFGVVFLLFMIGLELSLERLKALRRYVFGLGSLQVGITGLVVGIIALLFGATPEAAIVIGGGFALSSTAFVVQLLSEKGQQTSKVGLVSFAILLLQDIAVVPLLTLVPLLGQTDTSLLSALGTATFKTVAALGGIMILGYLVLRPFYRVVASAHSPELFVATTLLVILGTSWIMHLAGLSMALGAFLAGLLLAETEYRHQVEADIRPFKGIFVGLFFMTVGMSIDLSFIVENISTILLLVFALLFGKSILITIICLCFRLTPTTAIKTGMMLSQGGEFGFVLFGTAMASSVIDQATGQILLATIAFSMVLTPTMVSLSNKISKAVLAKRKYSVSRLSDEFEDESGHVLIAGFGRVGQAVAKVLTAHGIHYIALDMDYARVAKCKAQQMPVFYGDASRMEILRSARVRHASAVVVTIDNATVANRVVSVIHQKCPDMQIFVRAQNKKHSSFLQKKDVTAIVPEASEASLQLGGIVLHSLGVSNDEIAQSIEVLRENDYEELDNIIRGKSE